MSALIKLMSALINFTRAQYVTFGSVCICTHVRVPGTAVRVQTMMERLHTRGAVECVCLRVW